MNDKVAVVTGAGNGVGRELALQLLARGAKVACVDVNPAALDETLRLAAAREDRIGGFVADITDRAAVEGLPEKILAQFGAVDVLVNNAGRIHPFLHVEEIDFETAERVMRVNYHGALNMTKAFLPYLRMQPGAYLVNLSSAGALSPMPGETVYGASKAAVHLLTEGLRYELRKSGVRVMAVFPGGINTDIMQNSGVAIASSIHNLRNRLAFLLLTPQKAAKKIIIGMERNHTRLVLGVDALVMDLFCRVSPRLAPRLFYRLIDTVLSPHVRADRAMPEK
ncbi:MAG: SDR family oxidoreductase [Christensenella sp.]|nr:SDR family oxidoreductase [Christensenella sp.]